MNRQNYDVHTSRSYEEKKKRLFYQRINRCGSRKGILYPCQVPKLSLPFVIGMFNDTPTIPDFKCPGYMPCLRVRLQCTFHHSSNYHIIRALGCVNVRECLWYNLVQAHFHVFLYIRIVIFIDHQ